MKKDFKKWGTFGVLVLAGGTIYKLSSLKDAFYVPMQEYFGLTHTQIGMAMSVYAIVQTLGYFVSMYVADRFSRRVLMPLGLIGTGAVGLYLATFPSYVGILASWAAMAFFADLLFWPVLVKSVRLLGDSSEQGRLFGFLEAGRGVVDTIVAFTALGLFINLGSNAASFRIAILFFAIVTIVTGIIVFFTVGDDEKEEKAEESSQEKNKKAMAGAKQVLKMPELWIASFMIFCVYGTYAGLTYFIPFLKDIYGMPVALVGAYGIINQYGLKMVGGPVGGIVTDKVFKSPTKYLRFTFLLSAIMIAIFAFLPHTSMNIYLGMACTLLIGSIVFTQRAIFFAPIDEINIPKEVSGAAISLACLIGYAPSIFSFALYGAVIDAFGGMAGYRVVFLIMSGFAVVGFIISNYLTHRLNKQKGAN
ncbi:MFS transporter [Vagococcus sp. DIV0080]|uniref:MFS transporter n=1 Tax=Candidatus Vagococcus giribetii TaxID=2230876 RepID=A0ABS3HV61_9ENTE|nr:MFS transporter [Vagococcus sp. DIV0080]MBO0477652.1 MFS transporter [Vagococcus sp. DIV0080]